MRRNNLLKRYEHTKKVHLQIAMWLCSSYYLSIFSTGFVDCLWTRYDDCYDIGLQSDGHSSAQVGQNRNGDGVGSQITGTYVFKSLQSGLTDFRWNFLSKNWWFSEFPQQKIIHVQ